MKTESILLAALLSLTLGCCAPSPSAKPLPTQTTIPVSQPTPPASPLPSMPTAPATLPAPTLPAPTLPAPTLPAPSPTTPSALPEPTQTQASLDTAPTSLDKMTEAARRDLASRLFVSIDQVSLVKAGPVNWANLSLGCPQPGLVYAEVITPGYLVILRSGEKQYEYHAGKDQAAFFCKNPQKPTQYDPSS